MRDLYYVYDASDGTLLIRKFHEATEATLEGRVMGEAEHYGMRWKNCSWGEVNFIRVNI